MKLLKQKIIFLHLTLLLSSLFTVFTPNNVTGQITINKTVSQQNVCNQFDVNLSITGIPSPQPLDVILVIDRSGSMATGSPSSMTYTKNAALNFVRKIFNPLNNPGNANRVGLVSYSNNAILNQQLCYSADSNLLVTAINNMVANGTTNIADGFYQASKEMQLRGRTLCNVQRSIVLFTDGVANEGSAFDAANDRWQGSSCTTSPITATNCTNSAILRGQEAQSFVNGGVTYSNRVYTIGLFGGIYGGAQAVATSTLTQAQNAGFYQTESGADLNGIYNQIFGQLIWAAQSLPGISMVTDTILNGFDIIPGTLASTQGTTAINGQNISWDIPFVNSGTLNMTYSVVSQTSGFCGTHVVGNSWINYQDPTCNIISTKFPEVSVCIPCTEVSQMSLVQASCGTSIQYNATLASGGNICMNGQQNYSWEFSKDGAIIGTASGLSGTFNIPSAYMQPTCNGTITAVLSYSNGTGCSIVMNIYTLENLVIDLTAPTISTIPGSLNTTVTCSSAIPSADLNAISATDNCIGAVTVSLVEDSIISGSCSNNFTINRIYRASDMCGNYSDFVQNITVKDTIAPIFTAPNAITLYSNSTCSYNASVSVTGDVTNENDNCSEGIQATFSDVVSTGSCQGSKIITRTWHLVDACGNTAADQQQIITILDTIAPVISTTSGSLNANLQCSDASGLAAALAMHPNATDNCGGLPMMHLISDNTLVNPDCAGSYVRTRIWNFTDACANTSPYFTQVITVSDNTAPQFTAPSNITIYTTAACTYNASAAFTGDVNNESDNCSTGLQATYTDVVSGGACAGSYVITRTWHLVDDCDNAASNQIQTITVSDTIAPVISCPQNINVANEPTLCGANVTVAQPTFSDNCSNVTVVNSINQTANASGFYPVGTTVVEWTATDACGNTASCQMTVTVNDTEAPVIECPADISTCSLPVNLGTPVVSDNCGIESVTNNAPQSFTSGTTIITWTVTDIHGNIATCDQTVNLANISASASGTSNLTCFDSNDGIIIVTASNGKAPYTYSLNGSTPQSSNEFINLAAGTYNITVIDAMQCIANTGMSIENREPLSTDAIVNNANCIGRNTGEIRLSVSGGTMPYQYNWSNGSTDQNLENLDAGDYAVTITDANGCELKYTEAIIPENQNVPLVINNAFSPNGDGINDYWVIKNIELYPGSELVVLNRWGNEIYTTKDYANNWDGSNLSEGTYLYILNVIMCGETQSISGYITLVR
jgi:gliding motility-associated-like protein